MHENTTAQGDPFAAINAALDIEEISWEPEPGERLTGRLLNVERAASKSGDEYPILRIEREDGAVVRVSAGRAVLKRKLEAAKAQAGDLIGLQYDGEAESKSGRMFHNYRVAVRQVGERGPDVFVADRETDPAEDLVAAATTPASAFADDAPF